MHSQWRGPVQICSLVFEILWFSWDRDALRIPATAYAQTLGASTIIEQRTGTRTSTILILIFMMVGCGRNRDDIVFEAFTEPFLDWYSLKLYSNGDFDMHIPSIDYGGKYHLSGDTIYLESIENEYRTMTTTVKGQRVVDTIVQQSWTFLIDAKTKRIRTVEPDSLRIAIDILTNKLP